MPLGWMLLGTLSESAKHPGLVLLWRTRNDPIGSCDSTSRAISLGMPAWYHGASRSSSSSFTFRESCRLGGAGAKATLAASPLGLGDPEALLWRPLGEPDERRLRTEDRTLHASDDRGLDLSAELGGREPIGTGEDAPRPLSSSPSGPPMLGQR